MTASTRETVLDAVKALVIAALPFADVDRNQDAERVGGGGLVNILDGDPGEPEITLSPLTYTYEHRIPLQVAAYESATLTRSQVLDQMLQPIGVLVQADRTLGGLCEWLDVVAPAPDDIETVGALPIRWADVDLIAVYSTRNPLT